MTPTPYDNYNPYIPLLDAAGDSTYDTHMGFQPPEFKQTPPKLSLYSLPSKPTTLPDGLTPPLNTVATIPFLWEEAPGKPRPTSDDPPKSKTVRSLDLPPRLTTTATTTTATTATATVSPVNNGVGIEIIPSPTTVLSGPYEGVYGSKTLLGSPEKVVVVSSKSKGKMRMPLRKLMRKDGSPVKFSSWRWDSGDRSVERSPSLKFCSWRWDSFRDMGGGGGSGGGGGASLCSSFDERQKSMDSDDKIGKVTRKNSFTFDDGSNTTSSFLTNMFGTFKKAMPWRSRRSRR